MHPKLQDIEFVENRLLASNVDYDEQVCSTGNAPLNSSLSGHDTESQTKLEPFYLQSPEYTKLEDVGAEDYYSRFEYNASTKEITPDRISVYCKCEMPYNPDDLMIQCDGCKDWFHPVLLLARLPANAKDKTVVQLLWSKWRGKKQLVSITFCFIN
ncbi:hypothetical protein ACET3Z_001915 [Daucus carota]